MPEAKLPYQQIFKIRYAVLLVFKGEGTRPSPIPCQRVN